MSNQSFADLGVARAVTSSLAQHGITEPFAIQRDVIADVLAGRDVLAKSPTGSGKTLAFGIPLVQRIAADGPRPSALVPAPTRELATQIVDDIRGIAHARALRVTAVRRRRPGQAGPGRRPLAGAGGDTRSPRGPPHTGAFTLDAIRMLVLDEADRMLDMGFRPAVDRIVDRCPAARQTLFFSATLDGEAGLVAREYTRDPVVYERGPTQRRASADVEHRFVAVEHLHRLEALVAELRQDRELTLVFVRTKHGADRLVKRLRAHGIEAVAMHGNKSQRQREQALRRFESGAVDTLVATDVAARGIDVSGISHVINFDPPADSESYVHRIGRTGRAGAKGVGVTLVAPDEHRDVTRLATTLGLDHGLGGGSDAGHRSVSSPSATRKRAGSHRRSGRRRSPGRG